MEPRFAFWDRLDVPGTDACRIREGRYGARIEGQATFAMNGVLHGLSYRLDCRLDWSSERARVAGWIGGRDIALEMARQTDGQWALNGVPSRAVAGLQDIDLGFTQASNTNAIRRLGLAIGERVEMTAAWLDPEDWSLRPLDQVYRRLTETAYAYESTSHGYRAEIVTDRFGLVVSYPGLWSART